MNTKSTFKHWITLAKKDPNNIEILKRMTTRLLLRNGIWINDRTKMLIYHKINKELPLDIATYNAIYAQAIRTATNIANSFWLKYNANLIASNADVIYIFEKYIHSIKPPNLNNLYTLMMESPLGTGKTEWFYRNYIQKHRESASIIIIVPRRSLAKITANRFQIIDYEDAKGNNIIKDISIKGEAVQMSICVNSLPTLVRITVNISNIPLLIELIYSSCLPYSKYLSSTFMFNIALS